MNLIEADRPHYKANGSPVVCEFWRWFLFQCLGQGPAEMVVPYGESLLKVTKG